MSVRIENIKREIIEWAIIRNGNSLEEFYVQNPNVKMWIDGEKKPTVKQLEDFTHKVHVPFGYMFLQNPPEEILPIPFFRSGNIRSTNVSLNVFNTVQIIQERQNWLTEYLDELEFEDLEFVGKYSVDSNYLEIVNDIRKVLKLDIDWANKQTNWEQALNYLTNL